MIDKLTFTEGGKNLSVQRPDSWGHYCWGVQANPARLGRRGGWNDEGRI